MTWRNLFGTTDEPAYRQAQINTDEGQRIRAKAISSFKFEMKDEGGSVHTGGTMAAGNEAAMRALLDQVDRIRWRQRVAFWMLACVLAGLLLWISTISHRPQTDVREIVVWSVIATVFSVVYGAMALAIYISGQVRRILKAIEITRQ